MSAVAKPRLLTEEEYLRLERAAEFRSEFHRGEMFAMAGASLQHSRIKGNFETGLCLRFRGGPFEAVSGDLRVKVAPTGLFTYPDVVVFCGKPELLDRQMDTLLNPKLIVEVLSESTQDYDRGKKFEHYQTIASLEEYVLVAQDRPRCESYFRQPGGHWRYTPCEGLEAEVFLESVGVRVPLAELYADVEFPVAE